MPSKVFFNLRKEKRDAIVNAALKEFSENLFEKASLRSIIKKSGISIGSFYRYFESKDELYLYLLDFKFNELVDLNKVADKSKELNEKLNELLNSPLWQRFKDSSSDIRKKYYFRIENNLIYNDRLAEVIAAAKGSISDYETTSISFLLSVLPYILQELSIINDDAQYNELYLDLKSIILHGLMSNI